MSLVSSGHEGSLEGFEYRLIDKDLLLKTDAYTITQKKPPAVTANAVIFTSTFSILPIFYYSPTMIISRPILLR